MNERGSPFRGVLFAGLMIDQHGPKVIEFNVRFGDPEAEVILPRLKDDLLPLLVACANGTLCADAPRFYSDAALAVVMAARGYPGEPVRGSRIGGIEDAEAAPGVVVFHGGTREIDGAVFADGGRVLAITALGNNVAEAHRRAYAAVDRIKVAGGILPTRYWLAGDSSRKRIAGAVDGSRDRVANVRGPRVAIALGGGGARGIAHVLALEALDEMGIRPAAIAGTSMGAVVAAAYAAGIPGRAIRTHILRVLRNRSDVMSKLLRARVGRFADLVLRGRGNPVLLDPEICLDLFWPAGMPSRFEDLAIETIIVATNYLDRKRGCVRCGPLRPAVAGSMAIPGLFRPVMFGDGVLIDGGAVNPLPYDLLFRLADIVVAVDVTFGGRPPKRRTPSPFASMFGAAQIMQGAITAQKIKLRAPDVLVRPKVEHFSVLDFFRASQILRAADDSKEELKLLLAERMKAHDVKTTP